MTMRNSSKIRRATSDLLHKNPVIKRYVDTHAEQAAFKKEISKLKGSKYGVTVEGIQGAFLNMAKDKESGFDRHEARKVADAFIKQADIPSWKKRELMRPFYQARTFREDRSATGNTAVSGVKTDPKVSDSTGIGAKRFLSPSGNTMFSTPVIHEPFSKPNPKSTIDRVIEERRANGPRPVMPPGNGLSKHSYSIGQSGASMGPTPPQR